MRMGGRVAGVPGGAVRGVASRANQLRRSRAALGAEATRETAKSSLQGSARALADQRLRDARQTLAAAEGAGSASSAGAESRDSSAPSGKAKGKRKGSTGPVAADPGSADAGKGQAFEPPGPERYRRREGAGRPRRSQRKWLRWALERSRSAPFRSRGPRAACSSSHDPADHAHRAGYERTQFEALRGPERERAERGDREGAKARRQAAGGRLRACPAGSSGAAARRRSGCARAAKTLAISAPAPAANSCGACAASAAPRPCPHGATSAGGPSCPGAAAPTPGALLRGLRGAGGWRRSTSRAAGHPPPALARRRWRQPLRPPPRPAAGGAAALRAAIGGAGAPLSSPPSFATRSAMRGRGCGGRCAPTRPPALPPSCWAPRRAARRGASRQRCQDGWRSPSPRPRRRVRWSAAPPRAAAKRSSSPSSSKLAMAAWLASGPGE